MSSKWPRWSFFGCQKMTFKHVLQNQVPMIKMKMRMMIVMAILMMMTVKITITIKTLHGEKTKLSG